MTKRKTRHYRRLKPVDCVNPAACPDCILAALNSAIDPKQKVTGKKSSPGFWNLPTNRFGDRQNPFIEQ
jgi:hypothetical protein